MFCLTENEDGSANLEVEVDEEAKNMLIELGLQTLIKQAIEKEKESK